ncbi:MAG: aldo/keto reductase [Dehalococcoidia bacterium]|nr:aldo/keto reductase [Dehalococcoidia bacterium]
MIVMKYRGLGRTGVQVSTLCLGCLGFGLWTEEAESMDMIDHAIDSGINFLDTANMYGRGRSEEIVGKALKRNGKRSHIVLATKVNSPMDDEDPNATGSSRRHIIDQCEQSLKRLQTDYIDLYQVHRPRSDTPIDETLRALDDLIRAGKVRYIGTSNFSAWQLVESLWVSKELGLNRFVCEQPPYNMLDRRIERELVPMALTYGMGLIPWAPLARGFLTGKYRRGEIFPGEGRLTEERERMIAPTRTRLHFTEQAFAVVDVVGAIAKEKECTTSQVALAWCAQQPGIISPIIGPRTMEQLEDNLGAVSVHITDVDKSRIDSGALPGRAIVPYLIADFRPQQFRW